MARKPKILKFERLGMPLGGEAKRVEFVNYANELKSTWVSLFGRSCGRVDFIFPVIVGRMTADDAERLAQALLLSAKEAREAAAEANEDKIERQIEGAR